MHPMKICQAETVQGQENPENYTATLSEWDVM